MASNNDAAGRDGRSSDIDKVTEDLPDNCTAQLAPPVAGICDQDDSQSAVSHKRRKIHMDMQTCFEHAESKTGALPLTKPELRKTTTKDPNRGLYPRPLREKGRKPGGFISAKALLDPVQQWADAVSSQKPSSSQIETSSKRKKVTSNQRNKLTRYLSQTGSDTDSTTSSQSSPVKVKREFTDLCAKKPVDTLSPLSTPKKLTSMDTTSPLLTPKKETSVDTTSTLLTPKKETSVDTSSTLLTPKKETSVNTSSPLLTPKKQTSVTDYIYISSPEENLSTSHQKTKVKNENAIKKLFDKRNKKLPTMTKTSTRSKKKAEPKFNTDNKWLYSLDDTTSSSLSSTEPCTSQASVDKSTSKTSDDKSTSQASDDKSTSQASDNKSTSQASDDKYGLLGSGNYVDLVDSDDEDFSYFSIMPQEVLENVLCRLPLMDLCLNVNRVCKRWNAMVSNVKFLPWKKTYHKLKKGEKDAGATMRAHMRRHNMSYFNHYLPELIRYMKNFKPVTALNMISCLKSHPKYVCAEELLKERFTDCFIHDEPSPWSLITALVILSHDVKDVEDIANCLLNPISQCTAVEVIESLYCIATFLLAFKSTQLKGIWTGMHYRLFYGLYLFENSSFSTAGQLRSAFQKKGQQTIQKYGDANSSVKYTHEQLRICNYDVSPGDIIKIVAFAGTGKTTTLVKYTQIRPSMKFLLIVFNKSVCTHAESQFPHNVTCKTSHALAYRAVGWKYRKKFRGNLKVTEVVNQIQWRKGESAYVQAKFVIDTLNSFMASSDPFITTAHVPEKKSDSYGTTLIDHAVRMNLLKDAEMIWAKMIDPNNQRVGMTHDGYLKLYQLNQPKLMDWDVILIDEAQDLTPAVADILLTQSQPKILVGDPHQQIYAFRGAINAMDLVNASHIFYLTQSFRFGPEIAFVAASCLEYLKKVTKKTLVGNGIPGGISGERVGQLAIISRCNFTVFKEAVSKCCYSDEPIKIAFAGGSDAFGFDMINDIYSLMLKKDERQKEGRVIRNRFIQGFQDKGIRELQDYATKTSDQELLGKIKIVTTYGHLLPSLLPKIHQKTIADLDMADIVLSTAHKAKGLEFSTVQVTDDFNVLQENFLDDNILQGVLPSFSRNRNQSADEGNLLYVAVTRAKKRLQLNSTLVKLLKLVGEEFRYPVLSSTLQEKDCNELGNKEQLLKCVTGREFKPFNLTLRSQEPVLLDGVKHPPGLYSPQLVTKEMPGWRNLLGSLIDEKRDKKDQESAESDDSDDWDESEDIIWDRFMGVGALQNLIGDVIF